MSFCSNKIEMSEKTPNYKLLIKTPIRTEMTPQPISGVVLPHAASSITSIGRQEIFDARRFFEKN